MKRSHGPLATRTRVAKGRYVTPAAQIKELRIGSSVWICANPRYRGMPPLRFNNRFARIVGRRGKAYEVEFVNGNKTKRLVLRSTHLKPFEPFEIGKETGKETR